MKRVFCMVLLMPFLLSLAGCGGNTANSPHIGKWNAYACYVFESEVDIKEYYDNETSLELREKGKGVFTLNGESADVKWAVKGNELTITLDGEKLKGEIKDYLLTLDLLGLMDILFAKEGGAG